MTPAVPACRRRVRPLARLPATTLLATALGGCMVGPDYHRPAAVQPLLLKEIAPPPGWAFADPNYALLPRGAWWTLYDDPVLNDLESQIDISNQTIKQAEAAYRQSRALIDEARASLFPSASGNAGVTRDGIGGGAHPLSFKGIPTGPDHGFIGTTRYSTGTDANWQIDVWGQIRRQIESQVAAAQLSDADLANARLSAQATLATDYFNLRYEDSLQTLLSQFVAYYEESARITGNEYAAGTVASTDLLAAQTQVATTKAQLVSVGVLRAEYEHAIAVLTGHPPSDLSLAPGALTGTIPPIPVAVPSALLQRRPDIAAAERNMEEENALIGVAVSAFYPVISLSAAASYAGNPIGSLIQVANRTWSLGANAVETLFNGGERTAAVRAARASYDAAVANYRETVLAAFQNLEDDLSSLRILAQEAQAQALAVDLANQTVTVALNQYEAGTTIYITVLTDQTTALSNAESALSIQQQRIAASVDLVADLGGGFTAAQLPSKDSLQTDNPFLPSFIQKDRN